MVRQEQARAPWLTLARKMGFVYIDTGAMYRALAWKVLHTGISLDDAEAIAKLALSLEIHFETAGVSSGCFVMGKI